MDNQPNNPLHGKTLKAIVTELVDTFGWQQLGQDVNIRCFQNTPSIKSSLTFLRKTPWAREQVEHYYIERVLGISAPATTTPSKSTETKSAAKSSNSESPWRNWKARNKSH